MPELVLKEDDTLPKLTDTLDTAESLSGGSVTLVIQKRGSTDLVVNDTATVTDTTAGSADVEYQLSASQTANIGTHVGEWVVTYSDGDVETFPKTGYFEVTFSGQLNRGGTAVTPDTTGRAGPIDVLLINELSSDPSAPAADDWGVWKSTEDGAIDLIDQNATTYTLPGRTVEKSADYTANTTETVLADASSAAFNVTLPEPSPVVLVTIKKVDSSSNAVSIHPNEGDSPSGQTIDGLENVSISTQYASRSIVANSTDYFIQ